MRRFITCLTAFSLFLAPLSPVLAAPQGGLNLAMVVAGQQSLGQQPAAPAQQPDPPASSPPNGAASPPAQGGQLLLGTRRPADATAQPPAAPAEAAPPKPAPSAESTGAQLAAPAATEPPQAADSASAPPAAPSEPPRSPATQPEQPPAAQPAAAKPAAAKKSSPPAPALEPEVLPEGENGETVLEARERKARQRWYPWVALAVIVGAATAVTIISIKASKDERPDALDRASFLRGGPSNVGIRF